MEALIDWLRQPWPWWVGGPLIGLTVPLLLWLGNRSFGISSTLAGVCALVPRRPKALRFDWRSQGWNMVFAAGVVIGGWIAGSFLLGPDGPAVGEAARHTMADMGLGPVDGLMPEALFTWESLRTWPAWVVLLGGGFLVGFGARWAGGCTSGHAITGLSNLQPASLLAVVGFFAGGLVSAWWIVPWLVGLLVGDPTGGGGALP